MREGTENGIVLLNFINLSHFLIQTEASKRLVLSTIQANFYSEQFVQLSSTAALETECDTAALISYSHCYARPTQQAQRIEQGRLFLF